MLLFGSRMADARRISFVAVVAAVVLTALVVQPDASASQAARFFVPKAAALAVCACVALIAAGPRALRGGRAADVVLVAHLGWMFVRAAASPLPFGLASVDLFAQAAAFVLHVSARSQARPEGLASALIAAACGTAALALAESCGAHLFDDGLRRPAALLGNRNFVAAIVGAVLPLAAARLIERRSWSARLAVAALTAVTVLTRCRSVWLALLVVWVALGIAALARTGLRARLRPAAPDLLLATFAGALVAVAIPWPGLHWDDDALAGSALRLFEHQSGSGAVRVEQARVGLALLELHPLAGVGPRGWSDAAAAAAPSLLGGPREWTALPTPHSDLVRIAAEGGGIALTLALLGLLLAGRETMASWQGAPRPLELGAFAGTGVLLLHGLFDAPGVRPEALAVLAVTAAIARRAPETEAPAQAATWSATSGAIGLAAVALISVVQLGRREVANTLASRSASPERVGAALVWFDEPAIALRHAVRPRTDAAEGLRVAEDALRLAPSDPAALRLAARAAERAHATERARTLERALAAIGAPVRARRRSR